MQNSFQQIALKEIQKIALLLENAKFFVTESSKKLYNFEIIVNRGNEQVKLLVYFGKKGLKKVLQGNEEAKIYNEIKKIIFGSELFENGYKQDLKYEDYIGTDESGKGDYFGPLVVAAVYVDKESQIKLNELGVKDSKLLSDTFIKSIEKKIIKIVDHNFDIVIINPEKYNKLYESFGNLNKLLGWAHSKTIENLSQRVNCSGVISDKFGNEKIIKDELQKKKIQLDLYQTPKAERYIGVAAASILARAKVIDWFDSKSKELGIHLAKGAGSEISKIAKSVLYQKGENYLRNLVKFHFKNSKEIFSNN